MPDAGRYHGAFYCRNRSQDTKWNGPYTAQADPPHFEGLIMLGDISVADEIYIVCGYTDMRRSIDGLCAIVQDRLHMNPRQRALYLFCGKRCDRLKALL